MVVGEGFVNHQEHNASEEGEGQADKNGDLEGDRTESHTVGWSQLMCFQAIQAAPQHLEPTGSLVLEVEAPRVQGIPCILALSVTTI